MFVIHTSNINNIYIYKFLILAPETCFGPDLVAGVSIDCPQLFMLCLPFSACTKIKYPKYLLINEKK